MQKTMTRRGLGIFLAVVISLSCAVVVRAQEETLPPDLQKKFEKGLAAAEASSWDIAVKYFKEILADRPFYFPAYFNIALAHEKAGNELAALAYFKGYLHHVAAAEDRAQVEKEVTRLEVSVEAKIAKIMKQAEEAALTVPEGKDQWSSPRLEALKSVYYQYTNMLDEEGAKNFARRHLSQDKYYSANNTHVIIADNYISDEQVDKGLDMVASLPAEDRSGTLCKAAEKVYYAGDKGRAAKLLGEAEKIFGSDRFLADIAKMLIEQNQPDAALQLIEKNEYTGTKFDMLPAVAGALAAAGKKTAAIALIDKLKALIDAGSDISDKFTYGIKSAQAYEAAGEPARARATIDGLDFSAYPYQKEYLQMPAAILYAKLGDLKKAEEIQRILTDPTFRPRTAFTIADDLIKKGKYADAEKFLPYVEPNPFNMFELGETLAKVGWHYLASGDRAGYARIEQMAREKEAKGPTKTIAVYDKEIAVIAWKNGKKDIAVEHIRKISDKWVREAGICAQADYEIKEGRPEEAIALLAAERDQWKGSDREAWIIGSGLDACDKILAKGPSPKLKEFVDLLADFAEKEKQFDNFGRIGAVYEKLGEKDLAARFAAYDKDMSWLKLAREFESGDTADPDGYFQKIKDKGAQELPGAIARLALAYANGLRKIGKNEEALAAGKK